MKVSLRWLADYIDLPTDDPATIEGAFTSLGLKVENVTNWSAEWRGVVIARVAEVEPHPRADRLRLCRVDDGSEVASVVCGAWNFEAGAVVAYARPGAELPGGIRIDRKKIRGAESAGMICSERELGLGDDHTGIIVLDGDAPLGADFAEWVELPDTVFELEITPNRPDAMSMVGLARELAAYFGVAYRRPETELETVPGEPSVGVEIADPEGCYRFTLRELRDTEVRPSPFRMRRRLRAAGIRPINNVVDVTNYVMVELGHPLHAFDADRVAGDRLVVRRAEPGEHLVTLDGVDRRLTAEDLVICDADGPTSLAGTMGGEASEVRPETRRVLLEAASWDPPTILWMARRHGLRSEASSRFERGVDPNLPEIASSRAARLMASLSGGKILSGLVDEVAVRFDPIRIELPVREVTRILGPGWDSAGVAAALRSVELTVEGDDPLTVTVPTFRRDLTRPIDLVEEVARLKGYDSFPETVPHGPGGGWTARQQRRRRLRDALAGAGLNEALTLPFVTPEDLRAFSVADEEVVKVVNPLREEESMLRPSLLPGLLRSLRRNLAHGLESPGLFEIGKVFVNRPHPDDPRIPEQPDRVGFALVGSFGPRDLAGDARPVDVYTVTGLLELLVHVLGLNDLERTPSAAPGFHPGRTAEISMGGRSIGVIGELHPIVAAAYELEGRVAVGELELEPLVGPRPPIALRALSTYPPVEFDLAFVVSHQVPAARLVEVTVGAAGELVETARVFDEYTGFAEDRKSVAIHYVLRASDRTLTGEETARVRQAMIAAAAELGAELRGAS